MRSILLRKLFRDIRKSWAQNVALAFIIMLGVTSYISMLGAYRDLGDSYTHTYQQLLFADISYKISPTDAHIVDTVNKIPGVAAAQGRLILDLGMVRPGTTGKAGKEEQIRARLIGLPRDTHPSVNDVLLLSGRYFMPGDRKAVLIESHFAATYQLVPGDIVYPIIGGKELAFEVIGIVASPEYLIVSPNKQEIIPTARNFAVLFLSIDDLYRIFQVNNAVNEIAVRFEPGANPQSINEAIKKPLERIGLIETTFRKNQPSNNALQADLAGFEEIAVIMPGIILLVAVFSVYVMLGRLVRAQQREIGLMKAIGFSNQTVVWSYLGYSALLGLTGSLTGILLGSWLDGLLTSEYALELGIPLVTTRVYPDLIWQGVLLSIITCLAAGVGPAISTTRVAPAAAMRLDPTIALESGRRTIIDRFLHLPVWLRMVLRNLLRARRRSLSTALGIIFSFIMILMTWGMLDAMSTMVDRYFNTTNRWDFLVALNDPAAGGLERVLEKEWRGVKKVEPLIMLPGTIHSSGSEKDVLINGLSPNQNLYRFSMSAGGTPAEALADQRVIITTSLAQNLGLQPGQKTILTILNKDREVVIGGTTDEMMTSNIYVDFQTARDWSNDRQLPAYGYYLKVDPAFEKEIVTRLYHLGGVASVQRKSSMEADWQALFGLFYSFTGTVLLFAMVMVFALQFNSITVNILERERELATMRSIGMDGRQVAMIITAESFFLFLIALGPGILAGSWAADQMGNAFKTELFSFSMVVSARSYIISAVCILITILLAAIPALRRINRLNLAESTKILT